jgi:CRP-like cAMP-binding protein
MNFYVIIKGSVHILVKKKITVDISSEEKNIIDQKKRELNNFLSRKQSSFLQEDFMLDLKKDENLSSSNFSKQKTIYNTSSPQEPSSPTRIRNSHQQRNSSRKMIDLIKKGSRFFNSLPAFDEENVKDLDSINDEIFLESMYPDLVSVKIMKEGESFGEIALTKNIKRTATVLCREDTHLAFLSKVSFAEILSN